MKSHKGITPLWFLLVQPGPEHCRGHHSVCSSLVQVPGMSLALPGKLTLWPSLCHFWSLDTDMLKLDFLTQFCTFPYDLLLFQREAPGIPHCVMLNTEFPNHKGPQNTLWAQPKEAGSVPKPAFPPPTPALKKETPLESVLCWKSSELPP